MVQPYHPPLSWLLHSTAAMCPNGRFPSRAGWLLEMVSKRHRHARHQGWSFCPWTTRILAIGQPNTWSCQPDWDHTHRNFLENWKRTSSRSLTQIQMVPPPNSQPSSTCRQSFDWGSQISSTFHTCSQTSVQLQLSLEQNSVTAFS